MQNKTRRRVRWLAKRFAPIDYQITRKLKFNDLGLGYDPFGMEIESAMMGFMLFNLVYKYWFRVESHGIEHVPETGPALITPNHSGVLPLDGAMIGVDLAKNMKNPRIMRAVADHFFGFLPFINTALYRCGQVVGARRNVEELFQRGELLALFPEGAKGTGKLFWDRYKLRSFNVGFMELSLTYRVPIVPCAVIGGEEQFPMIFDVKPIARATSFPYFPITFFFPWLGPLGAVPLPVKYHIYYGKPFHFYKKYPPTTVKDPKVIRMLSEKVQKKVQEMVNEGLEKRKSLF